MVIVKLISGLGNQLFQYSFARRIALARNVPLKLDISFYESQELRTYRLDHFNIEADVLPIAQVDRFLKRNWFWMARKGWYATQQQLPYYKRRIVQEQEPFLYDVNLAKLGRNVYLDGYWQHYQYHQKYESIVKNELKVKEPYLSAISDLLSKIKEDQHSVSLHIRRGDYLTDTRANRRFGPLPLDYYRNALSVIKKRVASPKLYVFSDEIDWAKDNLSLDCPIHYVSVNDPSQDVLELFLMSRCKHNIIANSTFSWWGGYLNDSPNKIVIAPRQWSPDPKLNCDVCIQPPEWILI